MAWSYCWRYDCLRTDFWGKAYTATIEQVRAAAVCVPAVCGIAAWGCRRGALGAAVWDALCGTPPPDLYYICSFRWPYNARLLTYSHQSCVQVTKHNIAQMTPARYQLIHFVAPYGMTITTTFYFADAAMAPAACNSTVGSPVVSGRVQEVTLMPLSNLTIQFYIPAVWGIDGMAAAVVLRHIDGTDIPLPPAPPSPPPAPPAPPPLPATEASVLVTTDFLVLASVPVAALTSGSSNVVQSGCVGACVRAAVFISVAGRSAFAAACTQVQHAIHIAHSLTHSHKLTLSSTHPIYHSLAHLLCSCITAASLARHRHLTRCRAGTL